MMRILQVYHGGYLNNGVDRVTLTLTEGLIGLGAQVHALVPEDGTVAQELSRLGVDSTVAPLHCCEPNVSRARLKFFAEAARRVPVVEDLIRRTRAEVVHANTGHMLDVAVAAASCDVPVLWHFHSPIEIDHARYTPHLDLAGYGRVVGELGTRLVVVSNDMADSFAAFVPRERIDVLFSGVELADLDRRAAIPGPPLRTELSVAPTSRLVLGIGRVCAQKDFAAFVRVADRVCCADERTHFVVAGPFEEPGALEQVRAEIADRHLAGRVHLLGARSDVPRLIQQSDVVLSTAVFEGQGMSSIEAMALRRPVVAMACVGLRECIQHDHDGLLVPPGDEAAAADAVLRLLSDPQLAHRLGEAARLTVTQRFTREIFARRFLEVAQLSLAQCKAHEAHSLLPLVRGLLLQISETEGRVMAMEADARRGVWGRVTGKLRAAASGFGGSH